MDNHEALLKELDRLQAEFDRLTWRDYLSYYWKRTQCVFGRHRFKLGWFGGRVCLHCGRIDTRSRHNIDAYLICVVAGISYAAILFVPAFR